MREDVEVHSLGMFVHGALAALHGLGVVYNIRRKNYLDAGIHTAGLTYGLLSVYRHYQEVKENEDTDDMRRMRQDL